MPYRVRVGGVIAAASDEGLYTTFEQSSDLMLLMDPGDRHIVDANEAYARLVGYDRDELIGLDPAGFTVEGKSPVSLHEQDEMARQLLAHRGAVFNVRREMLRKDGSAPLVQWCFSGVTVAGRGLLLAVGVPVEDEADTSPLTEREREVVRLLALGRRGRDIATELFISPDTVETHTRNARLKLGAATLAELVAKGLSAGLI
jgi:PAS domain S-box-containing protein